MSIPDVNANEATGNWQSLWRPHKKWYLFYMPAGGLFMFLVGILFWGGFNTALEATNTEDFCISCHEMRDNVYKEYKQTIHYKNQAGVRATCPDCHVPRPWVYKILRKIRASNEILHKVMGTIDTREKFLSHRAELAEHVWATMKATDSRECRNCHAQVFMDLEAQDRIGRAEHAAMAETGKTCIDCHKGVAHDMPEGVKSN